MSITSDLDLTPCGAEFFRADLHIHSYGGSHDVDEVGMTPEAIVDTAIKEKLFVIAITDHNEITNVDRALAAAKGKQLLVVPGVELTTPQGHLLVYFENQEELGNFYGKLSFAGRGGKDSRCQTAILDCLRLIDPSKGFGILAHVDGGGGFEEVVPGYSPAKSDVISHQALLGIELRSATSTISYSSSDPEPLRAEFGKKRIAALGLGESQFLARVLFSDSHTLGFLGKNAQGNRKLTRIKMDSCTFNGIRVALLDADARIRLEDEIPQTVPRLAGIKLHGGFLDGQIIHFSKNLNCIIGGRGAGKSTAFQAARILASSPSDNKLIDSEVWPDKIELEWLDQVGQRHSLLRRIGEDPENLDDPVAGPVSFEIESYGQGDTAHTSEEAQEDPSKLLKYLDQFTDTGGLQVQDEEVRSQLLSNQSALEKADQNVGRIPEFKRLLANTQGQLKALESAKASEVITLERKVAEERTLRESIERRVSDLTSELKSTTVSDILEQIRQAAKPEDLKVGATEFREITKLVQSFAEEAANAKSEMAKKSELLAIDIRKHVEQWKLQERSTLETIEQKKKTLLAQGIKLDGMYIKKLATDEASYKESLRKLAEWETRLTELRKERTQLLKSRADVRAKISRKRVAFATRANRVLKDALTTSQSTSSLTKTLFHPKRRT